MPSPSGQPALPLIPQEIARQSLAISSSALQLLFIRENTTYPTSRDIEYHPDFLEGEFGMSFFVFLDCSVPFQFP